LKQANISTEDWNSI